MVSPSLSRHVRAPWSSSSSWKDITRQRKRLPLLIVCFVALFWIVLLVLHGALETEQEEMTDGDPLRRSSTIQWQFGQEGLESSLHRLKNRRGSLKLQKRQKAASSSSSSSSSSSFLWSPFQKLSGLTTSTAHKRKKGGGKPHVRETFEQNGHPFDDKERIKRVVDGLRVPPPGFMDHPQRAYDIYHCPDEPPAVYPVTWNVLEVLHAWNVDHTSPLPEKIHHGLCVMDWNTDYEKALRYREAEVPFVLQNHPEVLAASERWNSDHYLEDLLGTQEQRNEHSYNNHFMFWRTATKNNGANPGKNNGNWKPPTENVKLSYPEWKQHAAQVNVMTDEEQVHAEHWYFRLNAVLDVENTFLYDELPIFTPRHDQQDEDSVLFMVEPDQHRGINCRLGMKGVVAEAHFDPTRNWIVVMGGQRRYILAHPDQCWNLELYPQGHPSGRHSAVDWSHPPTTGTRFPNAQVNEVLLQPGDALYLPTSYFHFIVSLNTNYQCNARSGSTTENHHFLRTCGFEIY